MSGLVVLVEIRLKAGQAAAFAPLIAANAQASVHEPGCRRFDVCADPATAERVVLYEIYDDDAAFQAHMATPHYAVFAEGSKKLIESLTVQRLDLTQSPAAAD